MLRPGKVIAGVERQMAYFALKRIEPLSSLRFYAKFATLFALKRIEPLSSLRLTLSSLSYLRSLRPLGDLCGKENRTAEFAKAYAKCATLFAFFAPTCRSLR